MYGNRQTLRAACNFRKVLLIAINFKDMDLKGIAGCSIVTLALAGSLNASALTIEDYIAPGKNSPVAIKEMRPLSDGLTYAAISEDEIGRASCRERVWYLV